jgi:hypothetical protein
MLGKTALRKVFAVAFASVSLTGCAAYGSTTVEPYPYPYPSGIVEIPQGHMPPPGECRICYPDCRLASSRQRATVTSWSTRFRRVRCLYAAD